MARGKHSSGGAHDVRSALPQLDPAGHSRWENKGPKSLDVTLGNTRIAVWNVGKVLSVPNTLASEALAAGLTRKGPCK